MSQCWVTSQLACIRKRKQHSHALHCFRSCNYLLGCLAILMYSNKFVYRSSSTNKNVTAGKQRVTAAKKVNAMTRWKLGGASVKTLPVLFGIAEIEPGQLLGSCSSTGLSDLIKLHIISDRSFWLWLKLFFSWSLVITVHAS